MKSLLSQRVYQASRRSAFWTMYGRPIEEDGAGLMEPFSSVMGTDAPAASLTLAELKKTIESVRRLSTVYYIVSKWVPGTDENGEQVAFCLSSEMARKFSAGPNPLIVVHPEGVPALKQVFQDASMILKSLPRSVVESEANEDEAEAVADVEPTAERKQGGLDGQGEED